MTGGRAPRSFGIHAEVALKSILEAQGAIVVRASMSHGLCDLIALGTDDVALIEVKATKGAKYYASKSPGTKEAIFELARVVEQCAENVFAVVAVYYEPLGEYRFYRPDTILAGPVGPDDDDTVFACRPPRPSSPSVGSPSPEIRHAAGEGW